MFIETAFAMAPRPGGGEAGQAGPEAMIMQFLPFILIFVIFYFLLIRPQSKKAKEHRNMLDNLKRGDKVTTQGGIYGLVDSLDTMTVTLKIAENVKIKVSRSSIAGLRAE